MKRALILSPFFYPEPISTGKYNTYLARALVAEGFAVEVYCSHPLYPSWKVETSEAGMPGCEIHRGGSAMHYSRKPIIRRLLLEAWYALFCLYKLLRNRHEFDVVIPVFPPSLFAVMLPWLLPKATVVIGIVHDLQGVYASNSKGMLGRLLFGLISMVERRAFKNCDHIVYLSEGMRKTANAAYGIDPQKTAVQYPFNTIDEFSDRRHLGDILPDGQLKIVYSGALGEKQAPARIMDFFQAIMASREDIHCYVFSQGPVFDELQLLHKHPHLHFQPLVDEEDLPELLLRSTVQLLPQEPGTSDGSLPSKLPNMLAAGTRILCITDAGSELVDIISTYPLGEVVTEWDSSLLLQKLDHLLARPADGDILARNQLLSRFTRQGLVKHIIAQL